MLADQVAMHEKKQCQPMYVTFAAVVASVGGVLFGYDIGITSGALLQLREDFHLPSFEQEMVVSSVLMGAFFASFVGGNIVDSWGRKAGIGGSCFLFIIGAIILFFSWSVVMLIVGRVIVGAAVSLSVTAECTYIAEISPQNRRGMMVSLNEVGITAGFLLAYFINYVFISIENGWRYMFGAASILALLQGCGVAFLPNSHYYLLVKGKKEEARKVLCLLRDTNDVDKEIEAIQLSIEEQKNRSYLDLFSNTWNMRSRMFLGMTLVFLQQFSGNANVLYYAPTVFQHFGYHSDSLATLVTIGLGIVKVISTLVSLCLVDHVGRRTLLLTGCLLMATSIMVLGTFGTIEGDEWNSTNGNESKRESGNITNSIQIDKTSNYEDLKKISSIVSLMIFVCAYAISYGPVTWLVLSEIFPGSLRGRAVSVATCINWGSNIIISLTFLDILDAVGIGPTFVLYGFMSYGAAIFIFLCVPETKNKSLEEIDALVSKGLMQERLCASQQKYSVETMKVNSTSNEQQNFKYLDTNS